MTSSTRTLSPPKQTSTAPRIAAHIDSGGAAMFSSTTALSTTALSTSQRAAPVALLIALLAPLAASAQELGKGGSMASGGAGPNGSSNANSQLERCDGGPKGTLAVVEPQSVVIGNLQR